LGTHDPAHAAKEALRLGALDDRIWQALRNGAGDIEAAQAAISNANTLDVVRRIMKEKAGPRLADALASYVKKHRGRDARFFQNANRAFAMVKNILGNPALKEIRRADARRVLDSMLGEGLKSASVKRYLNTISAIISTGILELEIDAKNPFSSLTIPHFLEDKKAVRAFTNEELRQIAAAGLAQKTEPGLIACLQVETGCRVSEIALLQSGDVHLDAPVPFINITEHKEVGRRLKTSGSERVLPLVGCSLEAARAALASANKGDWIFPHIGKGNPQSTVNRWLARTLGANPGSHSARRSMETRLVLAGIDQRIIDSILGHAPQAKMGSVYFAGFSLADLARALEKISVEV